MGKIAGVHLVAALHFLPEDRDDPRFLGRGDGIRNRGDLAGALGGAEGGIEERLDGLRPAALGVVFMTSPAAIGAGDGLEFAVGPAVGGGVVVVGAGRGQRRTIGIDDGRKQFTAPREILIDVDLLGNELVGRVPHLGGDGAGLGHRVDDNCFLLLALAVALQQFPTLRHGIPNELVHNAHGSFDLGHHQVVVVHRIEVLEHPGNIGCLPCLIKKGTVEESDVRVVVIVDAKLLRCLGHHVGKALRSPDLADIGAVHDHLDPIPSGGIAQGRRGAEDGGGQLLFDSQCACGLAEVRATETERDVDATIVEVSAAGLTAGIAPFFDQLNIGNDRIRTGMISLIGGIIKQREPVGRIHADLLRHRKDPHAGILAVLWVLNTAKEENIIYIDKIERSVLHFDIGFHRNRELDRTIIAAS